MSEHKKPTRCNLGGRGVLITRPADQAETLCRLVLDAGGRAVRFPAIAIAPNSEQEKARDLLAKAWDLILFVSRNAVTWSLPLFPGNCVPAESRVAAIGAATAAALRASGRPPDLMPSGRFDSESLLSLPELESVSGQSVLIVRGAGGRKLLGDALIERGARVAYAEVYRRVMPQTDPGTLIADWRSNIHAVTATSNEILENLVRLVGANGQQLLITTPVVVVSTRTAQSASKLGFVHIEVADCASDGAVLAALCRVLASYQQLR